MARFSKFHVAFVIKRLLYIEFRVFIKKRKRKLEVQNGPERATAIFWFWVAIEFSGPVSREWLSVATCFGLGRAFFFAAIKAFLVPTEPPGSIS